MAARSLLRVARVSVLCALSCVTARDAWAIKLEADKDIYVDIKALIQPQLQLTDDAQANPEFLTDFFLRRTRIILDGEVSKYVSFFFDTDQPNWGKGGKWSDVPFYVQDAFGTFNIHEAFKIDAGMLLTPFVHQARQSAGNLHTLDYHAAMIKYPDGSNKVWRDMGAEIRGIFAAKMLDYRVMVSNGVPGTSDHIPRFSGRLALNFFDPEDGFFLGGTYLGKKKVLALGVAGDVQPEGFGGNLTTDERLKPYVATGGDLYWDIPLGKDRVSGQVDFVYYGANDNPQGGWGFLGDVGYAFDKLEPLVSADFYRPNGASSFKDTMFGLHVGLNYWLLGHNANIKADLGYVKDAGRVIERAARVLTLQTQILL